MEYAIQSLLFLVGLVVLLKGADFFTKGASRTARSLGVSEFMIGLTMVAFITSLPELAVSFIAVLEGSSGISLGNVVGSNIANIGLVLGISGLAISIPVSRGELKQGYMMAIVSVIASVFIMSGMDAFKGAVLVCGLFVYVYYLSREHGAENRMSEKRTGKDMKGIWKNLALCVIGGAGVVFGADLLINSAIGIARQFGLSETSIGMTLVAVGTSLPELSTSATAARNRMNSIAIGNVIGSNVFNLLMVLGAAAIAGPLVASSFMTSHAVPFMLLITFVLLLLMRVRKSISRMDGVLLLAFYSFFIYLKFFAS